MSEDAFESSLLACLVAVVGIEIGGDKVSEFTISTISPEASVGFWKGGIR